MRNRSRALHGVQHACNEGDCALHLRRMHYSPRLLRRAHAILRHGRQLDLSINNGVGTDVVPNITGKLNMDSKIGSTWSLKARL